MREERIVVNGVTLACEIHGDPDDPMLLLLHGAGQCLVAWLDGLVRRFVDAGRCVVRVDSRDAGRSTTSPAGEPGYGMTDAVEDVSALLDALETPRAHLVGVSGGAAVAQVVALDHPGQVATLTLMAGTPGGPGHEAGDLPPMTEELRAWFSAAGDAPPPDWSDREAAVDRLVEEERPFAAASRPFDEVQARQIAEKTVDRAVDLEAMMTNPFLVSAGEPWRHRLAEITAPTLVLHGEEDPLLPLGHGRALAAEIPGARLIEVTGMGHEIVPRHQWDRIVPEIVAHTEAPTGHR
ncbi:MULTISPECIES: alpha/beta hydrolase [Actinomycetes]|uniref:AB hydrolase-1 domain-containing protein n=2 Tax=Actinomycetes TaxID=1760 RepID=A0ABP6LTV3_9MICC